MVKKLTPDNIVLSKKVGIILGIVCIAFFAFVIYFIYGMDYNKKKRVTTTA